MSVYRDDGYTGRLVIRIDALCGGCSQWVTTGERKSREASVRLKKSGWTFTRAKGWRCPACSHAATCGVCAAGFCSTQWDLNRTSF